MSDMIKYRAVSFKNDQIVALYFIMSGIVHNLVYRKQKDQIILAPVWGNFGRFLGVLDFFNKSPFEITR